MDPVPDEPTPDGKGRGAERAFSVRNYGLNTWGSLFNARQQLALITFAEKVRLAHGRMVAEGYEPEFARAVVTYTGTRTPTYGPITSAAGGMRIAWGSEDG